MATNLQFPVINVVPAGYRWSPDAANKAGAKGSFLRVGGPQVTRRFLSGAKRSWASAKPEENQTIFHVGYRITGTPQAVRSALQYAGVDEATIQKVLATAITGANYQTTYADEYEAELGRHNANKDTKQPTEGYDFEQVLWFGKNIKSAVIQTKTGEQKGAVTAPGRTGAGDSLADKVRKLAQGKVLDVSNMDFNTGKGVRTVAAPKTAKSGKYGTGRIPIISNDYDRYVRAIQLAYGPDGVNEYAQDIGVVRTALGNAGRVPAFAGAPALAPGLGTRVPSPTRLPSPARVPGATLAPVPVFTATGTAVPRIASPRLGTQVPTVGGTGLPAIPALGNLLR